MIEFHAGGDAVLQLFEHHRGDARHVEWRASVIGSQTSSTSSLSGPTKPSSRRAIADTSAAKKRLSKRSGRFGGVMARAMKWIWLRSGTMPAVANGCHACRRRVHRLGRRHAEHQPGFLIGLAHRGERIGRRFRGARPFHPPHQRSQMTVIERGGDRHQPVGRLDAAAGKDEFARQEAMPLVTAAEQHLRDRLGAVDQNQRRRIPRFDVGKD